MLLSWCVHLRHFRATKGNLPKRQFILTVRLIPNLRPPPAFSLDSTFKALRRQPYIVWPPLLVKRCNGSCRLGYLEAVLRIRIRIRIRMFLGLLDPHPDPLVRGMDPDPSIIKQKIVRKILIVLFCDVFTTFYLWKIMYMYLQKVIIRKTF
jgi:hypothetical protein